MNWHGSTLNHSAFRFNFFRVCEIRYIIYEDVSRETSSFLLFLHKYPFSCASLTYAFSILVKWQLLLPFGPSQFPVQWICLDRILCHLLRTLASDKEKSRGWKNKVHTVNEKLCAILDAYKVSGYITDYTLLRNEPRSLVRGIEILGTITKPDLHNRSQTPPHMQ